MEITIHLDGKNYGPYTLDQIHESLSNGSLDENDLAWREGCRDWLPLKDIITPVTSPPPPPSKLPLRPLAINNLDASFDLKGSETTLTRVDKSLKQMRLEAEQLGMTTLSQLAKTLGVDEATISRWEEDENSIPLEYYKKWQAACGVRQRPASVLSTSRIIRIHKNVAD